jgi:hypothetical protein
VSQSVFEPPRTSCSPRSRRTNAGGAIPRRGGAAQDAQGFLVPTFTGDITIAVGNNPGNANLTGNTSVTAVGGLATFSNLSLDKAGPGYTLVASTTGLTGATSVAFNVASGTVTQLAFTLHPAVTTPSGSPITQLQGGTGCVQQHGAHVHRT